MLTKDERINLLKIKMEQNATDAEEIYKESIELSIMNEQFFMDWQDRLNKVSYVNIEDLI